MRALIGLVNTGILLSCHLDPRQYACARSYQKALGLNLKEKSSSRHVGQLKITKRGSAMARKYLYSAALRLIKSHPVVKAWYQRKVNPKAKNKTVIRSCINCQKPCGMWGEAKALMPINCSP